MPRAMANRWPRIKVRMASGKEFDGQIVGRGPEGLLTMSQGELPVDEMGSQMRKVGCSLELAKNPLPYVDSFFGEPSLGESKGEEEPNIWGKGVRSKGFLQLHTVLDDTVVVLIIVFVHNAFSLERIHLHEVPCLFSSAGSGPLASSYEDKPL